MNNLDRRTFRSIIQAQFRAPSLGYFLGGVAGLAEAAGGTFGAAVDAAGFAGGNTGFTAGGAGFGSVNTCCAFSAGAFSAFGAASGAAACVSNPQSCFFTLPFR